MPRQGTNRTWSIRCGISADNVPVDSDHREIVTSGRGYTRAASATEAANPVRAMAAATLIVLRRKILPAQPFDKSPCTHIQAQNPRADRG